MSPSHEIKSGTTDEVFQEHCFPWERGASVQTLTFFNFQDFLHAQEHETLKESVLNSSLKFNTRLKHIQKLPAIKSLPQGFCIFIVSQTIHVNNYY